MGEAAMVPASGDLEPGQHPPVPLDTGGRGHRVEDGLASQFVPEGDRGPAVEEHPVGDTLVQRLRRLFGSLKHQRDLGWGPDHRCGVHDGPGADREAGGPCCHRVADRGR